MVLIEVDIGDRLQKAEQRLRDGVKLVFGSAGWHEGKSTTWSLYFHAAGIDWDIPNELISVPQRKIKKMHYEPRRRIEEKTTQLKEAAIVNGTLGRYSKNFKFWEAFCNDFGFPVWIDELPRAQQARMVGLFAGLCASEGPNKSRAGNKYQTFDGKMAAVAFAHKAVRDARLNYRDPEFELIAQGYKRSNSQVERKQPVTTPMLLEMRRLLGPLDKQGRLL
ncbi:hypothetical protein PF001_g17797 [Phytophthora fragariae]|uniref:Uncharacterized protein n=1 Tax=Phytophthora fragariae TaxID=53985 RepID=A0A6A4CY70_9STRA|nr:hypothetical protein PF003_g19297 [Phytophthora fragariae]KAE9294388.1 hypothetical protein PF001_g17797 [Phytophthora fragariae]